MARKKPRRASAPISSQTTPTSSNTTTANNGEVKVLVTNVEQTEEKSIKEALPKADVMSQKAEQKVTPSSAIVGQVAQPEQAAEKSEQERTRTKSAPEVASDEKVESSQDQLTDSKKAKNASLDVGEDTTDGGEQRRRRSSQKDGRSGSLKVWQYKVHMHTGLIL